MVVKSHCSHPAGGVPLPRPPQRLTGEAALAALAQQGHHDATSAAAQRTKAAAQEEALRIAEEACTVRRLCSNSSWQLTRDTCLC
jgi:uncharacterized protein YbbK (DUF523 family)